MYFLYTFRKLLTLVILVGISAPILAADHTSTEQKDVGHQISTLTSTLLKKLNENQKTKIRLDFNSKTRTEWRYFPEPSLVTKLVFPSRSGISYLKLSTEARAIVDQTLGLALSSKGSDTVLSALELEKNKSVKFRGLLNSILFKYGPENYFVTVFGTPGTGNWAWRFEGHHVSINLTFEDSRLVSTSPLFLGTTTGDVVVEGETIHIMPEITVELKRFSSSLDEAQKASATQSLKKVPKFNPIAPSLFGGGTQTSELQKPGLRADKLSRAQLENLKIILTHFASELNESTRSHLVSLLNDDNLASLEVLWAGDFDLQSPFYFQVRSSKFAFELNTSEGHVDHYHVAWINL